MRITPKKIIINLPIEIEIQAETDSVDLANTLSKSLKFSESATMVGNVKYRTRSDLLSEEHLKQLLISAQDNGF